MVRYYAIFWRWKNSSMRVRKYVHYHTSQTTSSTSTTSDPISKADRESIRPGMNEWIKKINQSTIIPVAARTSSITQNIVAKKQIAFRLVTPKITQMWKRTNIKLDHHHHHHHHLSDFKPHVAMNENERRMMIIIISNTSKSILNQSRSITNRDSLIHSDCGICSARRNTNCLRPPIPTI